MLTLQHTGRQAIRTRYVGPGNVRGARIIASCDAGRVIVPYEHRLGIDDNHMEACRALCQKLSWDGTWVGGGTDDGRVWVDASYYMRAA